MPRTKLTRLVPDYTVFQNDLRGYMKRARLTTRTAGDKSAASISRWIREPWRFRIDDLALLLKNLHIEQEEQEALLLELFRQVQKKT